MVTAVLATLGLGLGLGACAAPVGVVPPIPARQPGSPNPALGPYPTQSMSPVPATLPEAARTKDTAGATAFMRYYVRLYNVNRVHPTTGSLAPYSLPSCQVCKGLEASIDQFAREQAHYVEPTATIVDLRTSVSGDDAVVGLEVQESPAILVDRWGGVIRWYDGNRAVYTVQLTWQNGWKVKEIGDASA